MALCIRHRSPRGHEARIPPSGTALAANDDGLAQVAARIAEELDLSSEAIDDLLFGSTRADAGAREH